MRALYGKLSDKKMFSKLPRDPNEVPDFYKDIHHPYLTNPFTYKVLNEKDKGKVDWGKWKNKKTKLLNGKTEKIFVGRKHPGTSEARLVLQDKGVELRCLKCNSKKHTQIHHINHNPFDNSFDNLTVLCRECHKKAHKIKSEIVNEFAEIPAEDDFEYVG